MRVLMLGVCVPSSCCERRWPPHVAACGGRCTMTRVVWSPVVKVIMCACTTCAMLSMHACEMGRSYDGHSSGQKACVWSEMRE